MTGHTVPYTSLVICRKVVLIFVVRIFSANAGVGHFGRDAELAADTINGLSKLIIISGSLTLPSTALFSFYFSKSHRRGRPRVGRRSHWWVKPHFLMDKHKFINVFYFAANAVAAFSGNSIRTGDEVGKLQNVYISLMCAFHKILFGFSWCPHL